MSLNIREHGGLIVAEHGQDEHAVTQALKQIDDRLILQKHPSDVEGGWVYKVLRWTSDSLPPDYVATWADEYGRPLPLTFGLVDLVNRLRIDAPHKGPDADERNRRLLEQIERTREDISRSVFDDHVAKVAKGRVSVSMGAGTKKRAWQRNSHHPEWLKDVRR